MAGVNGLTASEKKKMAVHLDEVLTILNVGLNRLDESSDGEIQAEKTKMKNAIKSLMTIVDEVEMNKEFSLEVLKKRKK